MVWCIRHGFLEDVRSRYSNFTSWNALVGERKSNAIKRAWPDAVDQSSDCNGQGASLFIEDALENLEREPEYSQEIGADLEVGCLQKDKRTFLRSKIEGTSGSYPFENLRTAADVLFLHGGSDLVVAKQAIVSFYHRLCYTLHCTLLFMNTQIRKPFSCFSSLLDSLTRI